MLDMNKKILFKWGFFFTIVLILIFGCSGKAVKTIEGDPEILYRQGLVLFNKRDYSEALKKFQELKSNFPDSPPYSIWAELKVGDCHFMKEEYVEAIAAYEEFKKIHPGHEETAYVQFQIGMSYFNQMRSYDRDQTPTLKALSNFEYLVANYPPSLFTEKAKEKIRICRKRLVDHEFYIGNFYFRHGKFLAAASRFEGILEKFPKEPDEDKYLFHLGKSYLELKQWEKANSVLMKIVTAFPNSFYFKEAKTLLEKSLIENRSLEKKKELKNDKEVVEEESHRFTFVHFEEEGRMPISFNEDKRTKIPVSTEAKLERPPFFSPPPQPSIRKEPSVEIRPPSPARSDEKGEPEDNQKTNLVDRTQPIDITSDKVEALRKENLIIFKGNVIARQRDLVIYADSIEAVILEDGKGIERVIAKGDVKIQQGLRIASCQKAIFNNFDQKIVLTGDPRVSEGENIVSGEEIIFDIEKNRIEVKSGSGGRGKAKIQP